LLGIEIRGDKRQLKLPGRGNRSRLQVFVRQELPQFGPHDSAARSIDYQSPNARLRHHSRARGNSGFTQCLE